jgi:hypothetical protein
MKSGKAIIAALVMVCALAGWMIWRHAAPPAVNLKPSAAVGEVLAAEVDRLLNGRGQVVLISREPPPSGPDANRERIAAFTAALKRKPGLTLAPPEWLPRPPAGVMDLGTVSEEQLLAAFDRHPEGRVFLILAGMPPFSPAVAEKVKVRSLHLIAVSGYSAHVRRWLEAKALAVVIFPRAGELPAGTPPPQTPRDWFDREYQLATPDQMGALPY